MEKLKHPDLLLDGDIIAYRASAATDGRQYVVKWKASDGNTLEQVEKYKKNADKLVQELQFEGITSTMTLEYQPEPVHHALKIVKDSMVSLETAIAPYVDGLGKMQVFISRGGSFREQEFPTYKQLREGMHRPAHLEACKAYLEKNYGAQAFPGQYEADDLMAIAQDGKHVICSIDKDLLQVPGHHFNWVKGEFTYVTQVDGWRNFYAQLLTGDDTDGIPGIKGIGPVKSRRIVDAYDDPFLMYCEVLKAYIRETGKRADETMDEYYLRCVMMVRARARLLYLLRSPSDQWKVPAKKPEPIYVNMAEEIAGDLVVTTMPYMPELDFAS